MPIIGGFEVLLAQLTSGLYSLIVELSKETVISALRLR